MKKYDVKELKDAIHLLEDGWMNVILEDFKKELQAEFKKRSAPKFVRATDAYLKKLKREDVYIRHMKETDEYYYQGMQGLFERKTHKLLRRHTDTGFLGLPQEKQ